MGWNPENKQLRLFSGLGAWRWQPDNVQNPENERECLLSGLGVALKLGRGDMVEGIS